MRAFLSGFVGSLDKYDLIWIAAMIVVVVIARKFRGQSAPRVWSLVEEHFNACLLLVLFLVSVLFNIALIHAHSDIATTEWGHGITTGFMNLIAYALGYKKPGETTNGDTKVDTSTVKVITTKTEKPPIT